MANIPTTPLNLAINSYEAISGIASKEKLVNCYVQPTPSQSTNTNSSIILGTAGLTTWKNLSIDEPVYGLRTMGNLLYAVIGTNVYKIDSDKNSTLLGTITDLPNRVQMADNGNHVGILTKAGNLYLANSNSLVQVSDLDYELSDSLTSLNTYLILSSRESFEFFTSVVADATSYPAAREFANNDSKKITAVKASNSELWVFKKTSIVTYNNDANTVFPFVKNLGVELGVGCVAKHTISFHKNGFYFLGSDKIIYSTSGYSLTPISTLPISEKIQNFTNVVNAFAFCYTQDGSDFYCITFPDEDQDITYEYNITTGRWHNRISRKNTKETRWLANCYEFFNNVNLVGDKDTGIIYQIDSQSYKEGQEPIVREVVSSTLSSSYSKIAVSRLVLFMEAGVGLVDGQGFDPKISFSISNDGQNFKFNESKSFGKIGEYDTELSFRQLGSARNFIFKIRMTDPVKFIINNAYLNANVGYS